MNKLKLLSVISVLSLLFFAAPALASANMLVNGGFETPDVPSGWAIYPDGAAGMGWTVEWYGGSETFGNFSRPIPQLEIHNSGVIAGVNAPEGSQYAELDTDWGMANNEPASVKISQAVNTCTTGEYELSFYLRKRTTDDAVAVTWDGNLLPLGTAPTTASWTKYTFPNLVASTASTILSITETGTPNTLGMFIDGVDLTQTSGCDLVVNKTVDSATMTRTYEWNIDKTVDQPTLTLAAGEVYNVNYTVDLTRTWADSNHEVDGTITITNPSVIDVEVSVADVLDDATLAVVNCPSNTVPAGGGLVCTYAATPVGGSATLNTATVTMDGRDFSATAPVVYVVTEEVDESVDVVDSFNGDLGTLADSGSFQYSRQIGPYAVVGEYTVDNTATFTTNDSSATGSDSASVVVTVPVSGCTLTQGYWKTHNESFHGGAPVDENWLNVSPLAEGTEFYSKGFSWFESFWTPIKGRVWYQLAHQWMAAKLNVLNGASITSEVDTALSEGLDWLMTHESGDKLKGSVAATARGYASTLAAYNEGLIGPGHCDEQVPAGI